MKNRLLISIIVLTVWGCDKQRDLYDVATPLLYIEGDWIPSLGEADMSNKATAMIYGNGTVTKQYFIKPNSVTTKVTKGSYDILLFNGLMFSEENTNLDHVYFRNTHNIEEFEAFAEEGIENKRLTKADGEFIVSNEMEILTAQRMTKEVEGEYQYFLKYKDGKNGYPTYEDYIESEVKITPKQVSYYAQIVITLKNPNSIHAANGSLRGFMRSVKMSTGEPTHLEGTHQLRLNNMKYTDPDSEEYGTIESPKFVTFGPPLDMPNREYEFEVKIVLKDGNIVDETFDITDQVEEAIDNIQTTKGTVINVPITLTIPIELEMELPVVDPDVGSGGINIGEWDDDEIIKIPIKKP